MLLSSWTAYILSTVQKVIIKAIPVFYSNYIQKSIKGFFFIVTGLILILPKQTSLKMKRIPEFIFHSFSF